MILLHNPPYQKDLVTHSVILRLVDGIQGEKITDFMSHYHAPCPFLYRLGVMPPDEYYYNVNNSVYTNTVAKFRYFESDDNIPAYNEHRQCENIFFFLSLQFAVELASRLQHPAPKEWQQVAENLKIPFEEESQYHPEYDGYTKGYYCIPVSVCASVRVQREMSMGTNNTKLADG